jgi:hypothetical protein
MKEKNVKRKQAMKKRREKILLKKALRHDISIFMVKIMCRMSMEPLHDYSRILSEGFQGFDHMRGSKLVKHFEEVYAKLHDEEGLQSVESYFANSHGQRTRASWELFKERDAKKAVQEYILESDALMNRLMELTFDLDVHE